MDHVSCGERLRKQDLLNLKERQLQGKFIAAPIRGKHRDFQEDGARLFRVVCTGRAKDKGQNFK